MWLRNFVLIQDSISSESSPSRTASVKVYTQTTYKVVKVYTHTCICLVPQLEVMTIHTVALTVLTEETKKGIQGLCVLLQSEHCSNGYCPSTTCHDADGHKLPSVFGISVRSIAEQVVEILVEHEHVIRHPKDVPIISVSEQCATDVAQPYFRCEAPSDPVWKTSSYVSPIARRAFDLC